jgi:hypothetical protein
MSGMKKEIKYQRISTDPQELVQPTGMRRPQKSALKGVLEEPYRVFFPLAIGAGILGVLVWPLFFWGAISIYPLELHIRLMTEGFVGGFVLGFLGTAGPRLLSARSLGLKELGGALILFLGMMFFHLIGYTMIGDVLFGGLIVGVLVAFGGRVMKRGDVPPPGFILAGMGVVSAAVGAGCLVAFRLVGEGAFLYRLGVLFVSQAFTLLPILGVGGYVLPMFLGLPGKHAFKDSRTPPPEWKKEAWLALAVGCLLVFGYLLEAIGRVQMGSLLRAVVSVFYLLRVVPFYLPMKSIGWLAQFIRVGLIFILAGQFLGVFFPLYRMGSIHTFFIIGMTCVVLGVATRAVVGHAGKGFLFRTPLRVFILIALGLIGSSIFRLCADHFMEDRSLLLAVASVLWAVPVLIWAIRVIPNVCVFDPED